MRKRRYLCLSILLGILPAPAIPAAFVPLHALLALATFRAASAAERAGAPGDSLLPTAALVEPLSPETHPLAEKIGQFLARQEAFEGFTPSGQTRADYLKVIAGQIKVMRGYQNADGRIIEPVGKAEMFFSTPCYAHAVAALAASGFVADPALLESGMKAMDVSTADLARGDAAGGHGDFFIYPLMMAFQLYAEVAPAARTAAWRENLRRIEPPKAYRAHGDKGNWTIVNLSGDYLRAAAGLTTMDYVEMRLAPQLRNFTVLGMYDEHGHPLPYDHFSRHYLGGMMLQGYRGKSFERCRDLVWRGAWTSLFMMSPTGQAPTGYRSSHHIWNEAEACVTYEIYAAQYAQAGRLAEAGVFKRAAHLSLQCVRDWLRPDGSGYIVKNRYPIEARHGYEGYSHHTCYNLLACSMLTQAWQFAEAGVPERPAPCDVGGYVVPILDPFHKVFASAGGTYVEYDTCGDHVYNPTGLLRVHVKGGHPQLGPSDGCASKFSGTDVNIAVGPLWQDASGAWRSLAETSPPAPRVDIVEEKPDQVVFRVTFSELRVKGRAGPGITVMEAITVEPAGVTVRDEITSSSVKSLRISYPMLVFDGLQKTQIRMNGNTLEMSMDGKGVQFEFLQPAGATLQRSGKELNHRNGTVEPVYGDVPGRTAVYEIRAPHLRP